MTKNQKIEVQFQRQIRLLKRENSLLKKELDRLKRENHLLKEDREFLQKEVQTLDDAAGENL